jgi:hypothetical protein
VHEAFSIYSLRFSNNRIKMRNSPLIAAISLGALLVSTLLPIRASAATLTVTNLADSGAGSLRSAIAGSASGDIILIATNGVITLTSGELTITTNLTITGPGATNLFVSGNNSNRIFFISSSNSTVSISGLTIDYGRAENGANGSNGSTGTPGGNGGNGGGIYNVGKLTLVGCSLVYNTAGIGGTGGTGSGNIFAYESLTD